MPAWIPPFPSISQHVRRLQGSFQGTATTHTHQLLDSIVAAIWFGEATLSFYNHLLRRDSAASSKPYPTMPTVVWNGRMSLKDFWCLKVSEFFRALPGWIWTLEWTWRCPPRRRAGIVSVLAVLTQRLEGYLSHVILFHVASFLKKWKTFLNLRIV